MLFLLETPEVPTRNSGPRQARLPIARAAVTLKVLCGSNAEAIPSTAYAEVDQLGMILSWPRYADYLIQLEGRTDSQSSKHKDQALSEKRVQNR